MTIKLKRVINCAGMSCNIFSSFVEDDQLDWPVVNFHVFTFSSFASNKPIEMEFEGPDRKSVV